MKVGDKITIKLVAVKEYMGCEGCDFHESVLCPEGMPKKYWPCKGKKVIFVKDDK